MQKIIIIILLSFLLFSCQKEEPFKSEMIVGRWEFDELTGELPDNYIIYSTPDKCPFISDHFIFTATGDFQSTILGSNCADSIMEFGLWEMNGKQLRVAMLGGDGHIINAEILRLDEVFLVLRTKTNTDKLQLWPFIRKQMSY